MAIDTFVGKGTPLTSAGLINASDLIGVGMRELWAVVTTEAAGVGFNRDRSPKILYERHIFHRLTAGIYDNTDSAISDGLPGGYVGGSPTVQYGRLYRAMLLNHDAALMSASWGMAQIMGFNAELAGFSNVRAFVAAMKLGEDEQMLALARFLKSAGLAKPLREHAWQDFARGYNGSGYARNGYDQKIEAAYGRDVPDLRVREMQMHLWYWGYKPGPLDGAIGPKTADAVRRWQRANGRPVSVDVTLSAWEQQTA